MTDARVVHAIADVEESLRERTGERQLTPGAVEALDVVYHALVYTGRPDALELWRSALWSGRLEPGAEEAAQAMLGTLFDAVDRGHPEEVSAVCDCLVGLVERGAAA